MPPSLQAHSHDANRQGSDAPPHVDAPEVGAGALAEKPAVTGVAAGSLAPKTYEDDPRYPEHAKPQAMPADQRGWLHDDEGLPPVEPASQHREGDAYRRGGASWFDVTFLILRELFAEQQILGGEGRTWVQAEYEIPRGIGEQCQPSACESRQVSEQTLICRHSRGTLLR
jgi:hypothetical protein